MIYTYTINYKKRWGIYRKERKEKSPEQSSRRKLGKNPWVNRYHKYLCPVINVYYI